MWLSAFVGASAMSITSEGQANSVCQGRPQSEERRVIFGFEGRDTGFKRCVFLGRPTILLLLSLILQTLMSSLM